MRTVLYLVLASVFAITARAASFKDNITIDALIVTKAELRRHMAAPDDDRLRPATYAELGASRGAAQPDYLVVRFLTTVPGHYFGEAEARINGAKHGPKLNVLLHFNKGWVEYFIPLDGYGWSIRQEGGPTVIVDWNSLDAK